MRFSPNSRCPLNPTRKNVSKLSGYFDMFLQHVEAIDMSKKRTYLDMFSGHVQDVDISPFHYNSSHHSYPEALTRLLAAPTSPRLPNKSPDKSADKSTRPATTGEVNPPAPNDRTSHDTSRRASHVPRWHQVSTKSAPSHTSRKFSPRHPARVNQLFNLPRNPNTETLLSSPLQPSTFNLQP